jgi:hypothetical protein
MLILHTSGDAIAAHRPPHARGRLRARRANTEGIRGRSFLAFRAIASDRTAPAPACDLDLLLLRGDPARWAWLPSDG